MKLTKTVLSAALCAALLLSSAIPAFAVETPSQKEEVIYIMTDAGGKVISVNAVNCFCSGSVIDYGDYTTVRMMNTTDAISQSGDRITFTTDADKAYYQGTMKSTAIPWDISIRYYLDGKEYSAADIAGKSGSLKIQLTITENAACSGGFYDDYALQTTFTLNTNQCKSIVADGATVANVGENKQISYTILPGNGIDTEITADVTDFEMEAVSINGIRLNLNVEIDDAELMKKIGELISAVKQLSDGASELNDNAAALLDGSDSLSNGAETLHMGAETLNNGISTLQNGITSMQNGINTLNAKSDDVTAGSAQIKTALKQIRSSLSTVTASADELSGLVAASSAVKQGIGDLYNGAAALRESTGYAQYKALMSKNGLDTDALKVGNGQAITTLQEQISSLRTALSQLEGAAGYETQAAELQTQICSLENVIALLNGNNAAISGTETYLNAVSYAVNDLYDGADKLKTEYAEFDTAVSGLVGALTELLPKLSQLSSGIDILVTEYTEFDARLNEYTDGVATIAASYAQIADGVYSLASGSRKLLDAASTMMDGTDELCGGLSGLHEGVGTLNDASNELYMNTDGMDIQLREKIDEVLASVGGSETPTVSFVSDKNTAVTSVQFVIKTAAVEKEEPAVTETLPKEQLTFWQKLLRLFGWY